MNHLSVKSGENLRIDIANRTIFDRFCHIILYRIKYGTLLLPITIHKWIVTGNVPREYNEKMMLISCHCCGECAFARPRVQSAAP